MTGMEARQSKSRLVLSPSGLVTDTKNRQNWDG
jgi:hypothetical protein